MENEIVLFETEDHEVKLHVPVENNTVWLNRKNDCRGRTAQRTEGDIWHVTFKGIVYISDEELWKGIFVAN